IRSLQGDHNLSAYNLKKSLQYNPGWNKAHKMLAREYELDGQVQNAISELQIYMQLCDPAERDSIQKVIDRLIIRGPQPQPLKVPITDQSKKVIPVQQGVSAKDPLRKQYPAVLAGSGNEGADQQFKEAVSLYESKKYNEALDKLKQVRGVVPSFTGVYYYGGLIRRETGQNKMAKINFLKGIGYPSEGYNGYLHVGKILAEEQNYNEAIKYMSLFIDKAPSEAEKKIGRDLIALYRKKMGTGAAVGNVPDETTAKTEDASEIPDDNDPVESRIIPQEKYITPIEIQIDSLLSMMTVDTLTDAGQKLLGGIREFQNANYDQSIKEFRRILASNPTGTVALNSIYNTGICYYKLHLFKDAENQFQQVIDKFPDHGAASQSLFLKACTYLERRDNGVGEKLLRNFLQTNKDHRWAGYAYERLGDAYLEMGQDKKVIDAYLQAVTKMNTATDHVRIYFKTGNVYVKLENPSRAIDAFRQAIAIGEKQSVFTRVPDAYYRIADEMYKQKEYKNALEYYTKVTRKYPAFQETPWGQFQIGTIYKNLKEYQKAIDTFKDLIKQFPDDYWAKQAKAKMEDTIWESEYQNVLK
ncbi:MAG TPA: tetratricopeptide repeat protein, partial [Chitinispirillaceae bacterium]|nr:tetratricopeptide repeat protein [Chitinispirillaceae bacterium]